LRGGGSLNLRLKTKKFEVIDYLKTEKDKGPSRLNLQPAFKIHVVLYRVGVFIQIKAEDALIGSGYGGGILKNRIGLKIGNALYFVARSPALALQFFFIIPAYDDRLDGFHRVEQIQGITAAQHIVQGGVRKVVGLYAFA
jgi:hypothetical protein